MKVELISISSLITALVGGAVAYKKYFSKKKKNLAKKELLTNHIIFSKLEAMKINIEMNFICEGEITKELVLKNLMLNKIDIGIKYLKQLAIAVDNLCDGTCIHNNINNNIETLKKLNNECLNNIIHDYNNYFRNGDYDNKEIECLEYALKKFNKIHQPAINVIFRALSLLSNDFMYSVCYKVKQDAIFYAYLTAYNFTLIDNIEVVESINGWFHNKKFKN